MNYKLFKDTYKAYVRTIAGQNYLTDLSLTEDTFANEQLQRFSVATRLLYKGGQSWTLTSGQAEYTIASLSGSPTPPAFFEIDDVIINNNLLTKEDGLAGPMSLSKLAYYTGGNFYASPNGVPVVWTRETYPGMIRLWPTPDAATAALSTHYIHGWFTHPTLSGDSDVILFPVEYHRLLCKFAAVELMDPYAQGDVLARQQKLQSEVEKEVAKVRAVAEERNQGATARRGGALSTWSLLGA
jgi:hypothetical protein